MNVSVRVDGIPDPRQEAIRNELLGIASFLDHVSQEDEFGCLKDGELLIWITDNFDSAVNSVQTEFDLEEAGRYSSRRESVRAAAKTMFFHKAARLKAAIVVNADLWDREDGESVYIRYEVLLHELCHVVWEAGHPALGNERRDNARLFEGYLRSVSSLAWEEHAIDTMANNILVALNIFRNDQGDPVQMADVLGPRFCESARQLLDSFCRWVDDRVHGYRLTGLGLQEILPELSEKVQELFVLLAHTIAMFHEAGRLQELKSGIWAGNGFASFLSADWEELTEALGQDEEPALNKIHLILTRFIERLGLRIGDLADGGCYIHVLAPHIKPG
jgi:hypothetical protein